MGERGWKEKSRRSRGSFALITSRLAAEMRWKTGKREAEGDQVAVYWPRLAVGFPDHAVSTHLLRKRELGREDHQN